jgi:signal transduction histidine kinase
MNRILLFVTFLFICISSPAQNNQIKFDHFTIQEGLPDRRLMTMTHDSLGYIWMGTQNGLLQHSRTSGVLLNLFNNAFYAVVQKQKTAGMNYKPGIEVTTFTPPLGGLGVSVRDNGTGIPDKIKAKIMQPFFTTKPTGEGTGLGLSLSYDIVVKGFGGNIQVNSTDGEGSEFIIQLPNH